jgi:hypothetical protein
VGSPAQAASPSSPALTDAANWLSGQLSNGLFVSGGYSDVGTTIWAARALEIEGGHAAAVSSIVTAVGQNLSGPSGYMDADECYPVSDTCTVHGYYATPAANALVFAEAEHQNVSSYNGVDVLGALKNRMITTGPSTGRIADDSSYGDYANTIGQALAALGLTQAGDVSAQSALDFLLQQQCSAGYFRLNFTTDKSATDQSCDGGSASGASPADPDATAAVLLQLNQIANPSTAVENAIGSAKTWLLHQQHADGSFNGGTSTNVPNANTTGLAGWALGELGNTEAARKAAVWVRQHQVQPLTACPTKLDAEKGAIAYDDATMAAGRKNGIGSSQYQWRLASAQATPVLNWLQATTSAPVLTAPTGYRQARTRAIFKVAGAAPGGALCLGLGSARVAGSASFSGTAKFSLVLPAGTANRRVSLTDATTTRTATVKVLGKKTFKVKSPARIKRGKKATVKVTRLAPRERYVVRLGSKVVKKGYASASGTVRLKVKVGKKLRKVKIKVTGQFPSIRSGAKTVRVTR